MVNIFGWDLPEHIKLLNRTSQKSGKPAFEWVASGFEINFKGEGIRVYFEKTQTNMPIYLSVVCDGRAWKFAVTSGDEVLLISDLPDTPHSLRVIRASESRSEDADPRLVIDHIIIEGENAEILAPSPEKERKIAIFGDSITCGYSVLSLNETPHFASFEEDVTKAYSYKTAQYFDADYQIVSVSGKGVYNDCDGNTDYTVYDYFSEIGFYSRQPYDHSGFTPDIIVLNIGTNDWSGKVEAQTFKKSMTDFLLLVRKTYPAAHIIWMFGAMGRGGLAEVSDEIVLQMSGSDKNMSFLFVKAVGASERVSDWHPNLKGQARLADELIAHIKANTDWK